MKIKIGVLFALLLLAGCSHNLTIHQPLEGAIFAGGSTITLDAEIRGGESGCGGEDCNCADWWWTADGTALGLDRSNDTEVDYCRYTWAIPASTLGAGSHSLSIHADQNWYRETWESVNITVQP